MRRSNSRLNRFFEALRNGAKAKRSNSRRKHLTGARSVEALEDRTVLSTITVTGLGDTMTDGDGQITLREAIEAANTDTAVDGSVAGSGDDTIVIDDALIGGTITLANGEILITNNLAIEGLGAAVFTINGNATSRAFDVDVDVTVSISDLRITNGNGDTAGGAIANGGSLTLDRVRIDNNTADEGGAIDNISAVSLTVRDSTIDNNSATDGPGELSMATLALFKLKTQPSNEMQQSILVEPSRLKRRPN